MNSAIWIVLFLFCMLFISEDALAFKCISRGQIVDNTSEAYGPAFFQEVIAPVELNKTVNKVELSNLQDFARCTGAPESYDALRTISVGALNPALAALGYELYMIDGDGREWDASAISEASNICLWPDARCSGNYPPFPTFKTLPVLAKIGIKRVAGSGDWNSVTTIPAGTRIAELESRVKMGKSWAYGGQDIRLTWQLMLGAEMTSRAYTCAITQYDRLVTLPSVARSDMLRHGAGRYPYTSKAFTFSLACDPQTRILMTFEGDSLTGTGVDEVLENKLAGNPNVGIQLLFNDVTPVTFSTPFPISASAQSTEIVTFSAYYYYKGGPLGGGPVKANATFTFDYQ